MKRLLIQTTSWVAFATLGCDRLAPKPAEETPPAKKAAADSKTIEGARQSKKADTEPKTVEDARAYMQRQIDRFLGGDRSDEVKIALFDLTLHVEADRGAQFNSVTLVSVLPKYSEDGKQIDNTFAARIKVNLKSVSTLHPGKELDATIEHTVLYLEGKWMVM